MIDWHPAKIPPTQDGEYLCYVRIPARLPGSRSSRGPMHYRYMTLEFAEGVFWVNGGAPDGFVLYYADLNPPPDEITPQLRGRKMRWVEQAAYAPICHICKVPLNQPDKTSTRDCGGDCLRCMAECGDTECMAVMAKLEPDNPKWKQD